MDSIKFKALLKSAEYGSLTKASEELGYTQAGLTHMMNRLEKEIGVKLLQRTKSGVKLTDEGCALLPAIKNFTQADTALMNSINIIRNKENKLLTIGAYPCIAQNILPSIITEFGQTSPKTTLRIFVGSHKELSEMLVSGEIDLAFISKNENLNGYRTPLCRDTFFAVMPADEKIPEDSIDLAFFENKPLLIPSYGDDLSIIEKTLAENNVTPLIDSSVADNETVISMVSCGLGYSILPELVIRNSSKSVSVKPVYPSFYRELEIIAKSKDSLSAAANKFIKVSLQIINK